MKRKIVITVVALSIIALMLSGCGQDNVSVGTEGGDSVDASVEADSTADRGIVGTIEAEHLISKGQAEEILGEPVKDGEKTEMASVGRKTIFYDAQEDGSWASLQISLTQQSFMPSGNTITPEETYQGAKAGLDDTSDLEITGIGDDCFTGTPGLHIVSQGYYIVIAAGNTNDPIVQAIIKEAGILAVKNLGAILAGQ